MPFISARLISFLMLVVDVATSFETASTSPAFFNETVGSLIFFPARAEIKQRRYNNPDTERRTWLNREFLLSSGQLSKFLCYVHPDSPRSTRVRFQIWRPVANTTSASTLQLVYEYPATLPLQGGQYTFDVPDRPLISDGSYFGWTYEEGVDPISQDVARDYPEYIHTFFDADTLPEVGRTLQFAEFRTNYRHSVGVAIDTTVSVPRQSKSLGEIITSTIIPISAK